MEAKKLHLHEGEADLQKCYLPARYVLTFLLFCAAFLEYAHRVCLSVTIVSMVNNTAFSSTNSSSSEFIVDSCPVSSPSNGNTSNSEAGDGEYLWSPTIQGVVLGSYFYGYVCTQIVGARISEVFGGKWPVGLATLFCSLLTLATPIAADIGVAAIVIIRVLMGMFHGLILPTAFALFSTWAPLEEKSTLMSLCFMGDYIGAVVSMPLAGYLSEYGFAGGWPSVYYTLGIVGCIWFVFWTLLVYNNPTEHPRISKVELKIIQNGQMEMGKKIPVPWKGIFSSVPIWATVIVFLCTTWGHTTILTKLPTYLDLILHVPIQKNGLVNSLIFGCSGISLCVCGYLSDFLRTKKRFNSTRVRKVFSGFATFGPAICMALVPSVGCHEFIAITLLTLSMILQSVAAGGHSSITQDMAPHHAGTIFGLANSIGNIASICAPLVAGLLLEEGHSSIYQWDKVFYIASGFYIFGGIVFVIFASSELQPWAEVPDAKKPLIVNYDPEDHCKGVIIISKPKGEINNVAQYGALS